VFNVDKMKKVIIFMLGITLFCSVPYSIRAEELPSIDENIITESIDDGEIFSLLPQKVQDELASMELDSVDPQKIMDIDPQKIFNYLLEKLKQQITQPLLAFTKVSGALVLLAFCKGLRTLADQNRGVFQVFEMISALVVCTSFVKPVLKCVSAAASAITSCSDFILSFLPIFSGILVACGNMSTASTAHVFLFWLCQITSRFASGTLVPFIGCYLSFSVVETVFQNKNMSGITGAIKSILGWALGLTMTIFVGALSLSSVVSASGDNLGTRTARFVLGSFVPVVGGALSEAFATAQNCLHFIKNSIGVYGVFASGFVFIPAIIQLVLWYFSVNCSALAAQIFELDGVGRLLKSISSALGILLALLLSFMLLLTISVTLILMIAGR